MSVEEQFHAAVKVIRSLPKNGSFQPSDELKLTFYALFKQATEGPNNTRKPAFYDIVNRYKWAAWSKCGEMSRQEAMSLYVEELKKVVETLSLNTEVSDFLDILGPFYEFLPEELTNGKDSSKQPDGPLSESLGDQVTMPAGRDHFCTYDSEGDEFADTIDTTTSPSNKVPVILQNGSISKQFSVPKVTLNGSKGEKQINGTETVPSSSNGPMGHVPGNSCAISVVNSIGDHSLGFNEQLTLAVFKLQHSLDRVVNRIDALESMLTIQSKCLQTEQSTRSSAISNWLFPELNSKTTAFVIAWPVIVFFALNYVKQIRKK